MKVIVRRVAGGEWPKAYLRTGRGNETLVDPTAKGFSLLRMDPAARFLGDHYATCFA